MNKRNKLLVGCLSLMLVLSVGYALFSETVTINGTATAKGSFDITTTCGPGYSDEFITAMGNPEGVTNDIFQGGFENSICDVKDNVVTAATDLLYPTANRYFTIKMENTGSIPALIWGATSGGLIESLSLSKSYSYSIIERDSGEVVLSGSGKIIRDNISYGNKYTRGGQFYYVSKNGEFFPEGSVIKNIDKNIGGIKLEPGDSLFAIIEFIYEEVASNALKDNGKNEYFEFKLNHEFKWEQYTDSSNYESSSVDDWCFMGC